MNTETPKICDRCLRLRQHVYCLPVSQKNNIHEFENLQGAFRNKNEVINIRSLAADISGN
jgi:hypothetical protein